MQRAARTAAWTKSGYTAKDYVQDGLIAMWDGIENAGWGVHDPNATVWKDLSGNGNDLSLVNVGIESKSMRFSAGSYATRNELSETVNSDGITWEVVANIENTGDFIIFNFDKHLCAEFGRYRNILIATPSALPNGIGLNELTIPYVYFKHAAYIGRSIFLDGDSKTTGKVNIWTVYKTCIVGNRIKGGNYQLLGTVSALRLYNRAISESERSANYAIDKARFGLT